MTALLAILGLLGSVGLAGELPPARGANLAAGSVAAALAAPSPAPSAHQALGGVYRITYGSRKELGELARRLDIWEVHPEQGYAVALLGTIEIDRLQAEGYRLELARDQTERWLQGPSDISCYRDVNELYASLEGLTITYPLLTELIDYGDSWQRVEGVGGYDLLALRLTNREVQGPKPRFILMANIHARELTTPEVALHFAEYLLARYDIDADATWILDHHEIYLIATANPDGRQYAAAGCLQRKNRNTGNGGDQCALCSGGAQQGVDLNRNNPYGWGGAGTWVCDLTYQGIAPASEPETASLNNLVRSLVPDQRLDDESSPAPPGATGLLISLHSYGDLVLWPWGWPEDEITAAPNHVQLRTLGRKFAYFTGYTPQQANRLYPLTGDTTDWAYGELGIPAYTFELGDLFFQECVDLPAIQAENLGALLYAAKVARRPYRTPSGPDTLQLAVWPAEVASGNHVWLTATIDDTRYGAGGGPEPAQPVSAASYFVDVPPWITATIPITYHMAASDGVFDQPAEAVVAKVDTAGLSTGRHILYVRGQDAAGNWGPIGAVFFSIGAGDPRTSVYLPVVIRPPGWSGGSRTAPQ